MIVINNIFIYSLSLLGSIGLLTFPLGYLCEQIN